MGIVVNRYNHLGSHAALSCSPAEAGARVVQCALKRSLGLEVEPSQARVLWGECRQVLLDREMVDTVADAESSADGGLDTLERRDVTSALAQALTGLDWPLNGTSERESEHFFACLAGALRSRGIALSLRDLRNDRS